MNGPRSKYAALFDPHPCYDAWRLKFVAEQFDDMVACLRSWMETDHIAAERRHYVAQFEKALQQYQVSVLSNVCAPADFIHNAWPAYLRVLGDPNYFLSVQELLLIAEIGCQNVLIVSWDHATTDFAVQGHHDAGAGPYVFILLKGDVMQEGEVHSHYERLFLHADVKKACAESVRTARRQREEQARMDRLKERMHHQEAASSQQAISFHSLSARNEEEDRRKYQQ